MNAMIKRIYDALTDEEAKHYLFLVDERIQIQAAIIESQKHIEELLNRSIETKDKTIEALENTIKANGYTTRKS